MKTIEQMLGDTSYHIEFHGFLTNHAKHAVIALDALGASPDYIDEYRTDYAKTTYGFGLEEPKESDAVITESNWKSFLGHHEQFLSLCTFFEGRVETLGMEEALETYLPALLPGCVGSLLHGTIHLGFALHAGHRGMIIEGLAYLAFSFVSCYPQNFFPRDATSIAPDSTAIDSLLQISREWDSPSGALPSWVDGVLATEREHDAKYISVLKDTGAQLKIALVLTEGHPIIARTPDWMKDGKIETMWEQLYYAVTVLFLCKPGDFFLLHLLTCLFAMENIAAKLSADMQIRAIKCYWTAMIGVLLGMKAVPPVQKLKELNDEFCVLEDDVSSADVEADWKAQVDRAIADKEEHNAKMVFVLRYAWAKFGHMNVFRVAARHFTQTPVIA